MDQFKRAECPDSVGVPTAATEPRTSQAASSESRRRVHQNAEARFSRLWKALEEDDEETILEWPSDAVSDLWTEAEEGRFCRISGQISVPTMVLMIASSADLLNLGRIGQRFGFFSPEEGDMQMLEGISEMRAIISESIPAVMRSTSASTPITLSLDTDYSRVKPDRYVGKCTVYGRIVSRIERGDTYELLKIPGSSALPKQNREQRRAQKGATGDNDNEVRGPAIVVRPIAVSQ